ncbi:hypothetical protein FOMPIDRAFT_1024645 [Fomitopsis schrenkii]|uniref:Uncharacterized protein n=1 Tax=Fomitopsis schrenkii TaxID=2126942 RepID=S8F9P0_FOMSC|nr:hypothetical protein FOMPIDRAFT_1024645 [Fomitopsis schrenkii]
MAPGDDPQISTPAQVWNYDANVPPYTLFNRVFPAYPSPRDFHEVGLDDMPDGALQSTPQERVRMAREIRRAALDALFLEMYGQDVHTWEKCKKTFSRRMEEGGNAWIDNTIELIEHCEEGSHEHGRTAVRRPCHVPSCRAVLHKAQRDGLVGDGQQRRRGGYAGEGRRSAEVPR